MTAVINGTLTGIIRNSEEEFPLKLYLLMNNSDRDKFKHSYIKKITTIEPCRTAVSASETEGAQQNQSEIRNKFYR